jgi:hypothetical protein
LILRYASTRSVTSSFWRQQRRHVKPRWAATCYRRG